MELRVTNRKDDGTGTTGTLLIDGQYECDTLEPTITAQYPRIPSGRYAVELRFSQRFQMTTPHILDVPGRSDILIHPGNKPLDTHGCLLVGESTRHDWLRSSRAAFEKIMTLLRFNHEPMFITYDGV